MALKIVDGHCTIPRWKNSISFKDIDVSDRFAITSVEIPSGMLEEIGPMTFEGSYIEEIFIPANVTKIEGNAFGFCESLVKITVAEDNEFYCSEGNCCLTKDKTKVVFGCQTSIIPDSVKVIGEEAFNLKSLKSIRIPEGVKIIENFAFGGAGLTSIEIPESVEKMSEYSFANCDDLVSFKVSPNNKCFYTKDSKCYSRATNHIIYEHEATGDIDPSQDRLNISDADNSQNNDDAMFTEILSPEEERDFIYDFIKELRHDPDYEERKFYMDLGIQQLSEEYDFIIAQSNNYEISLGMTISPYNDEKVKTLYSLHVYSYFGLRECSLTFFSGEKNLSFESDRYGCIKKKVGQGMLQIILANDAKVRINGNVNETISVNPSVPHLYDVIAFKNANDAWSDDKVDDLYDSIFSYALNYRSQKQKERRTETLTKERESYINKLKDINIQDINTIINLVKNPHAIPELENLYQYSQKTGWSCPEIIQLEELLEPTFANNLIRRLDNYKKKQGIGTILKPALLIVGIIFWLVCVFVNITTSNLAWAYDALAWIPICFGILFLGLKFFISLDSQSADAIKKIANIIHINYES